MVNDSSLNLCRISLCEPRENTDVDYITNKSGLLSDGNISSRFCIEFGTDNPIIIVNINQVINVDDIICYIKNIPVHSKIYGRIIEVSDRYIIGEYINDISDMTEDNLRIKYKL